MDYKKLHKDTINRLQQMVSCGKITVEVARGICEDFIPESEDERIRKDIISLVNKWWKEDGYVAPRFSSQHEMLDWLEKQGEHANFFNKIQIGDKVTRNRDGVLVNLSQLNRVAKPAEKQGENSMGISETTKKKLEDNLNKALQKETCDSWNEFLDGGEQKPADKVEPMSLDEAIEHCKEKSCGNNACALEHKQLEKWLTELKELKEQKSAWSEEDENILNNILFHLKDNLKDNEVEFIAYKNWLKSLRPKNTWKPSDEQMNTLEYYMHTLICNEHKEVLFGLYADLKKLREE